jgi:hypothetical protein
METVQVRIWCTDENNVSIVDRYLELKSFAAVREAFSNVYPDKAVQYTEWQDLKTQDVFVTSAHRAIES